MSHNIEPNPPEDTDTTFTQNYAIAIAIMLPLGFMVGLLLLDNMAIGMALALAFSPVAAIVMGQKNRERILDAGEESAKNRDI